MDPNNSVIKRLLRTSVLNLVFLVGIFFYPLNSVKQISLVFADNFLQQIFAAEYANLRAVCNMESEWLL